MEALIFMGIQASGKSSFYKERFADTHLRLNLDMLKTRHREQTLLEAFLKAKQPFVVDNTNPERKQRAVYIQAAKAQGFRVIGYFFQSRIEDCKKRNAARATDEIVPLPGVLSTHAKLELPNLHEGFDQLYFVKINPSGFDVEEWKNEI